MRRIRLAVILTLSLILAPLAVEAQQAAKIARIGYLSPLSASADSAHREAFSQGLRDLGSESVHWLALLVGVVPE